MGREIVEQMVSQRTDIAQVVSVKPRATGEYPATPSLGDVRPTDAVGSCEALWDEAFANSQDMLIAMANEAVRDYEAGLTKPRGRAVRRISSVRSLQ